MNTSIIRKGIFTLFLVQAVFSLAIAQTKSLTVNGVSLRVTGTSTLHDWEMKGTAGTCSADFVLNAAGLPTTISTLNFTYPAESLKSEHSGMDGNAYKALKTKKSPSITFKQTSATVAADGTVKSQGQLTIAGVTKAVELTGKATVSAKTLVIKGSKVISMKDYSIDPPSFMMGAMKTGNDVTVYYELTFHE